jgi:hypothetical protein
VAALQGAVALADEDHLALAVGEDLRLDVAGRVQVALHVDLVATEGALGLALG